MSFHPSSTPMIGPTIADECQRIQAIEQKTGSKAYLVGGAVRDLLMGFQSQDRDYVLVGADESHLLAQGYFRIGKDFPVFLDSADPDKCQIAMARTERKNGNGHQGFLTSVDNVSLVDDLSRRDLTINAMAMGSDGMLVDPFGGKADLVLKQLRHTSPAFSEDPLRVLRIARFAARYDFSIHPETQALCQRMAEEGQLGHLVAERVWKELSLALMEPKPDVFVRALRECGALSVVLPEVDVLFGIPQTAEHHPEICTGEHILLCLARSAELNAPLQVRYAVLVHDLGKGLTEQHLLPRHIGHEETGAPLVVGVNKRFRVPKPIAKLAVMVCKHHLLSHRAFELSTGRLIRLIEEAGGAHASNILPGFVLATQCDAQGRLGRTHEPYPAADYLLEALECYRSVDTRSLVNPDSVEKTINAIHHAKSRAISAFKKRKAKETMDVSC